MARLFSLTGAVIAENIIHDYTAVLYVHGRMNNIKVLNIVTLRLPWSHTTYACMYDWRKFKRAEPTPVKMTSQTHEYLMF